MADGGRQNRIGRAMRILTLILLGVSFEALAQPYGRRYVRGAPRIPLVPECRPRP